MLRFDRKQQNSVKQLSFNKKIKEIYVKRSNRNENETMDWSKTGKEVHATLLIYLHAEYILWNVGLDEAQAGIKRAGRNINNLRYVDDTTH